MNSLIQFSSSLESIPTATAWYLADLGEALGKQKLFNVQSPQKLKVLREHALVESAVSSNRIEGVEADASRHRAAEEAAYPRQQRRLDGGFQHVQRRVVRLGVGDEFSQPGYH